MIISNSRRFIFFHVPKSGGTSITHLLDMGLSWNDLIVGGTKTGEVFNGEWARRFRVFKHTTPAQLHGVVGNETFGSFHKFLFVRDPLKRFESATQFLYQVVTEKREWALKAYSTEYLDEISQLKSVSNFANSKLFRAISEKPPASCNESELCFKPQSIYYSFLHETCRESSTFFKIENLEKALKSLVDMSIVTLSEIERSKVMTRKHNQGKKLLPVNMNEMDLRLINEIFSEDYRLFGYATAQASRHGN